MIFPTIFKCSLLIIFFNLPRLVVADSAPNSDQDFSQIEYFGSHSNGDEYFKGKISHFFLSLMPSCHMRSPMRLLAFSKYLPWLEKTN